MALQNFSTRVTRILIAEHNATFFSVMTSMGIFLICYTDSDKDVLNAVKVLVALYLAKAKKNLRTL